MKLNENFDNQYQCVIDVTKRSDVKNLLKKMSDNIPGIIQKAEFKIREDIAGDMVIMINNRNAIDESHFNIIRNYLNKIRKF